MREPTFRVKLTSCVIRSCVNQRSPRTVGGAEADPSGAEQEGPHRPTGGATTARWLVSVAVVGIAVNLVCNHGIPALTGVAGLATAAAVIGWLRHYPGTDLHRTALYLLWGRATAFSIASTVASPLRGVLEPALDGHDLAVAGTRRLDDRTR